MSDYCKSIYAIRDKVAGEIASPLFVSSNHDTAKRAFYGIIEKNEQYQPNCDFELLYLGVLDLKQSVIGSNGEHLIIADGNVSRETSN